MERIQLRDREFNHKLIWKAKHTFQRQNRGLHRKQTTQRFCSVNLRHIIMNIWGWLHTPESVSFFLLLDIFFIYISNVILFPGFPSGNLLSHAPFPASMRLFPHLPTTPASQPWNSSRLGHQTFTEPRVSPPIDALQGYTLLNMQLEPWVAPCVFFGWWFSPWEIWGWGAWSGWLTLLFFLWGCKHFQLLRSFL